jgi:DNA-binding NarL/FixJ family response regulator
MTANDLPMLETSSIRVIVADDHPMIRAGLVSIIDAEPDMEVVGEAAGGREAVELFRALRPDVLVTDLRMPEIGGVEATRMVLTEFPDARVLVLTTFGGDEDIHRALAAGAMGYLLKDMVRTEVLQAIRTVNRGYRAIPGEVASRVAEHLPRRPLSDRELEVLSLVARGMTNREVARALTRAEETVKIHLKNIYEKLGVRDRTEAVTTAIRRGILHID